MLTPLTMLGTNVPAVIKDC